MMDREIMMVLHCCRQTHIGHCDPCPLYQDGSFKNGKCLDVKDIEVLALLRRQQEALLRISSLILDYTYPGFDKDGKPVSIWRPDGFKKIEKILKDGSEKLICVPGDKVYQFSNGAVYESTVKNIIYDCGHIAFEEAAIGKQVFLTKKEAEKAVVDNGVMLPDEK